MRILLTNDDGIFAPGIAAIAGELSRQHEVTIVAPDSERSGAAHSFTLHTPLRAVPKLISGLEHIPAYAVNGTPVDCVKIGYGNLNIDPDLVVSGINIGANLGTDTLYSGTVSAAVEGALLGVKSIAVSDCSFRPKHLDTTVRVFIGLLPALVSSGTMLFNLNVPDVAEDELKGVRITTLGKQEYANKYIECTDPRNVKYYWTPVEKLTEHLPDEDSDERWICDGYATLTPLTTDLTDRNAIDELRRIYETCIDSSR